ncbi:hypothetical protein A2Z33_07385 [Candidatus Gottesmanbacteria bacterium RBG_16_52_11]|uniref:Peptidase M10 metallopeptidase domain-containing protein n=1 Tax=Candidatus Gottesmanbacteria bacterium RBG_16_52_11 TaxID=1798374 RepID=A0A1F5YYC0_9BACT|nr:MAG: hypothetical protein A2Z33_07385 [Candidatus Gottesmanbacteria bacterium RBG_16_52_11]
MVRNLLALVLIVFIIGLITYGAFYSALTLANPDNPLNRSYRKYFLKRYVLRSAFRLNRIGDARFEFGSSDEFPTLAVNVFSQNGEQLSAATLERVISELARITDKPSGIILNVTERLSGLSGQSSDDDLKRLSEGYGPGFDFRRKRAAVNLFVLNSYTGLPSLTGLVRDDHSIFIFMETVRQVARFQNDSVGTEVSTILHEFGHLMGADHSGECIMSPVVEDATYENLPTRIAENYCESDIREIGNALIN